VIFEISDLTLAPATDAAGPRLLGLMTNVSDRAVKDVSLSISLHDAAEGAPQLLDAAPLFWHIEPGESTPFHFDLERQPAADINVQVSSYQFSELDRASLEISSMQEFPVGFREQTLLATVRNDQGAPLTLHRVGLLVMSLDGQLLELREDMAYLSYLEPEASTPMLATFSPLAQDVEWKLFVDARPSEPIAAPEFKQVLDASLRLTDQGMPYILGALQNEGRTARKLTFLILAWNGDQLVGISQIRSILPVPPQGTFVYTASPDRSLRMLAEFEDPDALTFEIAFDHGRSSVSNLTSIDIPMRISSLEAIGNSLFIKGSLTNPESSPISSPTLLLEVRDLSGALQTGGWYPIASQISGGASLDFVINLPVPAGFEPAQAEIDIRSIGIQT
jgi:hypothetical protein